MREGEIAVMSYIQVYFHTHIVNAIHCNVETRGVFFLIVFRGHKKKRKETEGLLDKEQNSFEFASTGKSKC